MPLLLPKSASPATTTARSRAWKDLRHALLIWRSWLLTKQREARILTWINSLPSGPTATSLITVALASTSTMQRAHQARTVTRTKRASQRLLRATLTRRREITKLKSQTPSSAISTTLRTRTHPTTQGLTLAKMWLQPLKDTDRATRGTATEDEVQVTRRNPPSVDTVLMLEKIAIPRRIH